MECKGGAAELGSRQGHQQCTEPYIRSIITNLREKLPPNSPKLQDINDLERALDPVNLRVKSYRLKQPFSDDGTLGSTEITEFNL